MATAWLIAGMVAIRKKGVVDKGEKMAKTKWYQKPIYLMVALALVLSLGVEAVPMAGTLEASPDEATFYSTASDGELEWCDQPPYSAVHDASSGTVNAGSLRIRIGQLVYGSALCIYRGGLFFDTSSLPDDATITSATLSLYGSDDQSGTDFDITVVDGSVLEDPMVNSDYGVLLPQTAGGGTFNTAGFSTTGYNDIALNAMGINWISKTGTTKFGLRSSRDISATPPAGSEYVQIWANEKGEGYRPKLVVTYTIPPPVGGEAYPVNKASLLAPWIALIAAIITGTTIIRRRHRAQG